MSDLDDAICNFRYISAYEVLAELCRIFGVENVEAALGQIRSESSGAIPGAEVS